VLIATDHSNVDYGFVVEHAQLVVDARNACAHLPASVTDGKVVRA
jgi:hypothetical protein